MAAHEAPKPQGSGASSRLVADRGEGRGMYEIKVTRVTRPRPEKELKAEWERRHSYGDLPSPTSHRRAADVARPGYCVREVRHDSAHQARLAVHQHAVYLSRENGWRVMYPVRSDAHARAFLWTDTGPGNVGLGSVCFYPRQSECDAATWWVLKWAWSHPYARDKGFLSEAWPYFKARFGDFNVEEPLSAGMRHFLRKVGGNPRASGGSTLALESPFADS